MKIKTKISLGVGLLFALIVLLAIVSVQKVWLLAADTKNILTANYNSLQYGHNMLQAFEQTDTTGQILRVLEENIIAQEQNITEAEESQLTQQLRAHFQKFSNNRLDSAAMLNVRATINEIMKINLEAIQRKSAMAERTANDAVFWIGLIGSICFLIAFTLLVNLPATIADPIQALTESIKQIAAGNYTQRLYLKSSSEYGELANSFNVMAQKLEAYNNSNLAKLTIEKKRIETLINKMHDPVIGLDENKKVLFANEEALKICGLKANQMIGKLALELAEKNDLIRSLMQNIFTENKEPGLQPALKIFADGKESYFEKETMEIAIHHTAEQSPQYIGHVILLRNVTAYKELDSAKTNFIATISHEFKTPIAAIKMSLQLLDNGQIGALNEEQSSLLQSIRDDADRLLKITAELLNMTQVETGNIQLNVQPSNPREILQQAIEATRGQAEQKKIRFEWVGPDVLPQVLADSDKTTWVMTNLISNAIRHSYEHSLVRLGLQVIDNHIEFSVKDTGQGIPPQYMDKVFFRYFKVPGPNPEGTGLGLAISKEFIEAQGGKISVESDFGAGSTFRILLHKAG